jgi:hypothetical protein
MKKTLATLFSLLPLLIGPAPAFALFNVSQRGTVQSTFTSGALIYGNGTSPLAQTTRGQEEGRSPYGCERIKSRCKTGGLCCSEDSGRPNGFAEEIQTPPSETVNEQSGAYAASVAGSIGSGN